MPAYLVDTPADEMKDIVNINVNATLRVTYAVLPGMIQRYGDLFVIKCYFRTEVRSGSRV
jgi:short-subunit dehydrogenase